MPIRVLYILSGDEKKASSRVRGFWISEALNRYDISSTLQCKNRRRDLLLALFMLFRYDIVVFQKTYSRYHLWLMIVAKLLRKKAYFDLDDAPSRVGSLKTLRNVEKMMTIVDGVFAGSEKLREYCSCFQKNTVLLTSGIDLNRYPVRENKNKDKICLGWIGNGRHYKDDLVQILAEPLRILSQRYSLKLKIVGACGVKQIHEVFGSIERLETECIDEINWSDSKVVQEMIGSFDIGLYPLIFNEFNKYKCGFKALEYMASGIPVVSSPVAYNLEIIEHGLEGLFAKSTDEWVESLAVLIESSELRKIMGRAGRKKVEMKFNVEKNALIMKKVFDMHMRLSE